MSFADRGVPITAVAGSQETVPVQFIGDVTTKQRALLIFAFSLTLIDIVRFFVLPQGYQLAFTDAYEAVVVVAAAITCTAAAMRSSGILRGLWVALAAYFALNLAADMHDFVVEGSFTGVRVLPALEFLGWCTYFALALLIFFPIPENGKVKWKWLPIIDFLQAGIAIALACFQLVYLHHLTLHQEWTQFGQPELVRNVLICAGLLLRTLVEPSHRARAIYGVVGISFALITLCKLISPAYEAVPAAIIRPLTFWGIAILAANWDGKARDFVETGQRKNWLRMVLSMFAAATLLVVLLLVHVAPGRYRALSESIAVVSVVLFILRSTLAERSRYAAEEALRQRDQRLRAMFNHQVVGIVVTSPEKRWLEVNDTWCQMIGYTREELARLDWLSLTHPDDRERDLEKFRRVFAGESAQGSHEKRFIRKDGSILYTLISVDCVRRHDGSLEYFVGLATDISEQKRAEAALRESEDHYRDLIEHSEDLVCTHDLEGRLLSANPAPARILGYEVAEILRTPMRDMIVPEYRDLFDGYLARIKETGSDKGLMMVMTRTGERKTWEYSNTLRTDGVAAPVVRGIAHDVTERRRAELALQSSEQRYRMLFEKTVAGVAMIRMDGFVIDCNDAWARMFGYRVASECRGSLMASCYPDAKDRQEFLQELRRSGALLNREMELRRKDGTPLWLWLNSVLLTDAKGQSVIQSTVSDITPHKRAEEALRQSEERFRVALKDSPITVFSQDRDLRYTWIYNPQLYWQHEAIGKTDEEIIGLKRATGLSDVKKRVLKGGTAVREEVAIPQNGNNFVFDMTIEPLFDADRNVVGITGSYMDIARLREMTDRLQEAKDKLAEEKSYLESEIRTELGFEKIIGESPALQEVLKKTRIVAPTDSTVLLLGETGTGKELIARSVHSRSARREQTFVKLNCAAVPSGLLESELFGHEKGAFTGAVSKKIGRIELADKGTLFLDEIGELPLELQPKLLRVLQDREFERLGGVQTLHVNVRIISATNRDLQQDVADRKFREDLFYRLNVFPIEMPPLRERRDDIPVLVWHFVHKHAKKMGKHIDAIPDEVMHTLRTSSWPGNIRELENMIERMVILNKSHVLAEPPAELKDAEDLAEDNLSEIEREHIIRILRETNGVLSGTDGAASRLGVKRTTLQSMIKRLGIESQDYRRASGTFGK